MYVGVIYFLGPKTRFAGGKVHEKEIIARIETPWRWFTRLRTGAAFEALDRTRCGYAIMHEERCTEHCEARDPE